MSEFKELQSEFDAEDGSFLIGLRGELNWDKDAFRNLTRLMYQAASEMQGQSDIPVEIAQGFWFCDTWIRHWTSHENFPRPEVQYYEDSLELIHDLAYFLFMGLTARDAFSTRPLQRR